LIGVQDLLQRHKLIEADIALIGEKVERVSNEARAFCEMSAAEKHEPIRIMMQRSLMSGFRGCRIPIRRYVLEGFVGHWTLQLGFVGFWVGPEGMLNFESY